MLQSTKLIVKYLLFLLSPGHLLPLLEAASVTTCHCPTVTPAFIPISKQVQDPG